MIEIEVYARSSVTNIPTVVIWVLLAVFVIGLCLLLWRSKNVYDNLYINYWLRGVARLMLVEWMVLVLCTTVVFRNTRAASSINLIPLSSYFCIAENSYLMEVAAINILNVVLFIPVGLLLKLAFCNDDNHNVNLNWKGAMLVGFLISIAIEVLQFVFRKGLCEVDDVIHNVAGCMLGYGVASLMLTLTRGIVNLKKN